MAKRLIAVGATALLLLLLASVSDRSATAFQGSERLHGLLCVDLSCGEEAYGLEVVASINGTECGRATSGPHKEQGDFLTTAYFDILVASAGDVQGCGFPGGTIDFFVAGRKANEVTYWQTFENGLELSVGDAAYLSGNIAYGDDYYAWPCGEPCNGPLLKAFVGTTECGSLQSFANDYHSYFRWLIVVGADTKPGCAHPGDHITFSVDGVPAHERDDWYAGFSSATLTTGPRSHYFYGSACIDSDCTPTILGRPVVAKIGDTVCGQTETAFPVSDGIEQSLYRFIVAPNQKTPGCGTEGATVAFYIDGRKTGQSATWTDGGFTNLNLWVGSDFAAFNGTAVCNGKPCYNCFSPCPTATIKAYIGDVLCGETIPYGYLINSSYGPLIVKSADTLPGCGTPAATIHFTINDRVVPETATWSPGFRAMVLYSGDELWGDINCSRHIDAQDALAIIRRIVDQNSHVDCFGPFQNLHLPPFDLTTVWADIDCNGALSLEDALKILFVAAEITIQQAPGCPAPGDIVHAYPVTNS